jgi:hypothetical protein
VSEHRRVLAVLLLASVLPEVESPLPPRIGLGFPFSSAGAGSVLVGIAHIASSPPRRDRAIRMGALVGFALGAGLYFAALLVQVA